MTRIDSHRHRVPYPAIATLVIGACTTLFGMPAAVAQSALPGPQVVTIQPTAYFKRADNTCGGGTLKVQVKAENNPTGGIQVGFFESSAGAIGDQMNASGWLSALVSTQLSERDLRDFRISYSWSGLIDGPSAGGLMTSAILAMFRGDRISDKATMTGTINPDGTIGPVGGIAHKIAGAAAAGIKRLAIPLGKRKDVNQCSGEVEDMIDIGRRHNVEVVEVGDIRQAYAFLTGSRLAPAPNKPVDQIFPDDLRDDFHALYKIWMRRFTKAERIVASARPRDYPKPFRVFWRDAQRFRQSGDRELQLGHEPAAFNRIWTAVINAEFVARSIKATQALNTSGFAGMHQIVDQEIATIESTIAATLKELRGIRIRSATDAGAVASIGHQVAASLAFLQQGKKEFALARQRLKKARRQELKEIAKLSFGALAHAGLAGPVMDLARAGTGWLGRDKKALLKHPKPILVSRELFQSAARSNLKYVDSLHTAIVSKRRKLDMASAQEWTKREDIIYLAATGTLAQQFRFKKLFDDGYVAVVAQLGALMGSVTNASVLVAKYYSVGAKVDGVGRVTGLRRRSALQRMTAMAEQAALSAMGEAQHATDGASTPLLLSSLDIARRNRDEAVNPQDQLNALGHFWGTSLTARLITRLVRGN